jgi:hypothetical protein
MRIKYHHGYYPEEEYTVLSGRKIWDEELEIHLFIFTVEGEINPLHHTDLNHNELYATDFSYDPESGLFVAQLPENF